MNKIIFTICSNNYLAQAKTLGDSIKETNTDYKFIIILCDKKNSQIDYSFFNNCEILEIDKLNIDAFEQMKKKYDITELNTSIKPFIFRYIYDNLNADFVYYIDPDIVIYEKLSCIEKLLETNNAVLTPHILKPVKENKFPTIENALMTTGIYNLGFLATKKSVTIDEMLKWWSDRLLIGCYNRRYIGAFVDQLPMTHSTVFFDKIVSSKNFGLNVAHWNLHERKISIKDGKYYVNETEPLIFFHFSGYSPLKPNQITKRWPDCTFKHGEETLKLLHDNYRETLLKNKFQELSQYKCVYIRNDWLENKIIYFQKVLLFIVNKLNIITDIIRTR